MVGRPRLNQAEGANARPLAERGSTKATGRRNGSSRSTDGPPLSARGQYNSFCRRLPSKKSPSDVARLK